jgi:predicted transcriptional regulator
MPKISQLQSYTNPQDSDIQPIVDTTNTTTKKITWSSIKSALKSYFDTLYAAISHLHTGVYQEKNSNLDVYSTKTPPSGNVVGDTDTQSLSNKRIYPRQSTATSPTSITPDKSQFDEYYVTALANAITINNASSPSVGDTFVIYLTDDGTARSISWGTHYVGIGASLPTSTTANKTMEIIIKYVGSAKSLVSYTNQV